MGDLDQSEASFLTACATPAPMRTSNLIEEQVLHDIPDNVSDLPSMQHLSIDDAQDSKLTLPRLDLADDEGENIPPLELHQHHHAVAVGDEADSLPPFDIHQPVAADEGGKLLNAHEVKADVPFLNLDDPLISVEGQCDSHFPEVKAGEPFLNFEDSIGTDVVQNDSFFPHVKEEEESFLNIEEPTPADVDTKLNPVETPSEDTDISPVDEEYSAGDDDVNNHVHVPVVKQEDMQDFGTSDEQNQPHLPEAKTEVGLFSESQAEHTVSNHALEVNDSEPFESNECSPLVKEEPEILFEPIESASKVKEEVDLVPVSECTVGTSRILQKDEFDSFKSEVVQASPTACPPLNNDNRASGSEQVFKHEPTIPSGPKLHTQRRALSYRASRPQPRESTSGESSSRAKDPIELYKSGATVPIGPTLRVHRRRSQTAAVRQAESNATAVELGTNAAVIARMRASKSGSSPLARGASPLALSRVDSLPKLVARRTRKSRLSGNKKCKDLADTYALVSTNPTSPSLATKDRVSSSRTSEADANGVFRRAAAKLSSEHDLANSYKLEPTVPCDVRIHSEERIMKNSKRCSTSKVCESKSVDLAATYELKTTIPTRPFFALEQRLGKYRENVVEEPKTTEPDLASSYKLVPTIPEDNRLSYVPVKCGSPTVSKVDLADSYELQATVPKPYHLSFTKPRTSITRPASVQSPRQPFRARAMPDFSAEPAQPPRRRHSARSISNTPSKFEKLEAPLKATVPMAKKLESEKRHEEYVARSQLQRSLSQASIGEVLRERKPFSLLSVSRHEVAMANWRDKVAEEHDAMERRRCFKASPLYQDMLDGATFWPETGVRPITTPLDVVTASRDRAIDRAEYDHRNALRVAQEEEEREIARLMQEKEEEKKALQKTVFRARPVPPSLYQKPEPVVTPRSSTRRDENDSNVNTDEQPGSGYSPKEIIAGVRRALGRIGSPV